MSSPLPPLLQFEEALELRNVCLHAAWHAANIHAGYEEDASRDLAALERLLPTLSEVGALVASQLAPAASRLALHTLDRQPDEAATASAELSSALDQLGTQLSSADTAALIGEMASAAGRHAAQVRRGEGLAAQRSLVRMLRAFHRCATWRRRKWVGVNLGGWLLLEYGPASPLFQQQASVMGGGWRVAGGGW